MDIATPVLLTGEAGYLGSHLRDWLPETGAEVHLLVRSKSRITPGENETVVYGGLTEGVDTGGVRAVTHLAALTGVERAVDRPIDAWSVNATGTVKLLESAWESNADRFVFVSTASIYGSPKYLPIDESRPRQSIELYVPSNQAADQAVNAYRDAYDLDAATLRLFNTYGPGQPNYNVVPTIVSKTLEDDTVEIPRRAASVSRPRSLGGEPINEMSEGLRDTVEPHRPA